LLKGSAAHLFIASVLSQPRSATQGRGIGPFNKLKTKTPRIRSFGQYDFHSSFGDLVPKPRYNCFAFASILCLQPNVNLIEMASRLQVL